MPLVRCEDSSSSKPSSIQPQQAWPLFSPSRLIKSIRPREDETAGRAVSPRWDSAADSCGFIKSDRRERVYAPPQASAGAREDGQRWSGCDESVPSRGPSESAYLTVTPFYTRKGA